MGHFKTLKGVEMVKLFYELENLSTPVIKKIRKMYKNEDTSFRNE